MRKLLVVVLWILASASWADTGQYGTLMFPVDAWKNDYVPIEVVMPIENSPALAKALTWRLKQDISLYFTAKAPKKGGLYIPARCVIAVDHEEDIRPKDGRFVIRCWSWPPELPLPVEERFEAETVQDVLDAVREYSRRYFHRGNQSLPLISTGIHA